jgi:hypothetical protein
VGLDDRSLALAQAARQINLGSTRSGGAMTRKKTAKSSKYQAFEHPESTNPMRLRALSIRQPHAEAIMRGVKQIEYRSRPTKIRGRVFIYACLGRYPVEDEAEMMKEYGIKDVACDGLPRGVIVGSVELVDCHGGDWHLRKPERATALVKPKNQPQPVWFYPF